jgi:glyoxylase-like metal-dependent hydrolase (beta-lactamase superfamily II)
MKVAAFFDQATFTVSYVVSDPATSACAIVDPVLDYDHAASRTSLQSAQPVIDYVRANHLRVEVILETHAHADHLSAAAHLKTVFGTKIAIGAHIVEVQKIFARIFNLSRDFTPDGRQFDRLFSDGDTFRIGDLTARVMHTPGHTPACLTYLIGDAAFVGDTLFQPDYGTARADFPGGDAAVLYRSIKKILSLPSATRLFTCHDYKAPGRDAFVWESTVREQRAGNIHVRDGIDEAAFVAMRTARDKTLSTPQLQLPALQVNIRAGAMPPQESNGVSYLKLPINAF